tara:strand:+ start:278 stop:1306 length:1029 start_codon:yes stop_codon:yes gene_type:complete
MGKTTFVVGGVDGVTDKEETIFNYDTKFMVMTSFTGQDMLMTAVRAGNFSMIDPFGMGMDMGMGKAGGDARLGTSFSSSNNLKLHKAFYRFPLGDDIEVTFGPELRQDDLLGVWPSSYPRDEILFVLNQAGAGDTYSKKMGAGAGIKWSKDKFVASTLLVAEDADNSTKGILQDNSSDIITTQLAWVDDSYVFALAYTNSDNGNTDGSADGDDYSSFGISGTYKFFSDFNIVPSSISAGMGWKSPDNLDSPDTASNSVEDGATWTVSSIWNDVFREDDNLGLAIGTAETHREDSGYDYPLAWELFYQLQINDSVTITPAVFVVEKNGEEDISGFLVKTMFKF